MNDVMVTERLARIETNVAAMLGLMEQMARHSEALARLQERASQHGSDLEQLKDQAGVLADANQRTALDLHKWVNRGIGAYSASTVLVGVIAFLLLRMVSDYEGQIRTAGDMLVTLDRRVGWIEHEMRGRGEPPKKGP